MKYGTTDGVLKPIDEVLLPDPRFECFALTSATGVRPFDLPDMHGRLNGFRLSSGAPEKVRIQFETARNLMLYAWFVFEFQTVAEMQAYAALELALGERFGFPTREVRGGKGMKRVRLMLSELLRKAVKEKIIVADQLPTWKRIQSRNAWYREQYGIAERGKPSAKKWLDRAIEILPRWRNGLAHGECKLLLDGSFFQLEFCGDLINALFPAPNL